MACFADYSTPGVRGWGWGWGGGCVLYYETGMDYTVRNSRLEDMAQWLYRSACYAKEKTRVQIPGTHVKARCTVPEPVISAFLWGDTCRKQENPSCSEACWAGRRSRKTDPASNSVKGKDQHPRLSLQPPHVRWHAHATSNGWACPCTLNKK